MARWLTCPTIASIDSLRTRAYKRLKATPHTRTKAYRAANHALDATVKASKYVKEAAWVRSNPRPGESDAILAKQYCTWARWAYNDAKASYARAKKPGSR